MNGKVTVHRFDPQNMQRSWMRPGGLRALASGITLILNDTDNDDDFEEMLAEVVDTHRIEEPRDVAEAFKAHPPVPVKKGHIHLGFSSGFPLVVIIDVPKGKQRLRFYEICARGLKHAEEVAAATKLVKEHGIPMQQAAALMFDGTDSVN